MRSLGILAMMTLLLMTAVYAGTCTVNTPGASARLMGSYLVNISLSAPTVYNNRTVHNCTVSATSSKTGDTYTFYAINYTAAPHADTEAYANVTIGTNEMIDGDDWSFAVSCSNMSDPVAAIDTCTRTGIIVDNTVPICTHTQTGNTEYKPTQTWTVTCTNATSAKIQFGGRTAETMAESSDVCTYTGSGNTVPEAIYAEITAVTSDETNTTSCTLNYITIDVDATAKNVAAAMAISGAQKKGEETGTSGGTNTIMWILLIGAGILIAKKKKWL